jgi:nucleotide-binding universal stress UspA family protein
MKNIIIPVDFSLQSEFALETGAILAKKHNARLHVLHMLELSDSLISQSNTENKNEMLFLFALTKKKFEQFLEKDYLQGIKVEPMVKRYKVYNEVDLVAKTVKADLIIMGSKGITSQDGIFAGSNAEKMVRNSNTPVLIVKTKPKDFDLKKIVYAASLETESIPAYKKAVNLFSTLGSRVNPVYVNRPFNGFISSREFNEKRDVFAQAGGIGKVEFVAGHTVEEGLIHYAEEIKADCIAVSTHARKGLNHFLNGSISEDLANSATLPIMTFKI